jgi:TatA/E family protein of Tat protein translocase
MFGLGMGELIVILAIALIFLGPKRLPDVATSLGKAIRSFRKATRDLTDQLDIDDEVKKPLRELTSALRDEPPPPQAMATMQLPPPKSEGIKPVPVAKADVPAAPSGTAAPPLPASATATPPRPASVTPPPSPTADKKA